MSRLSEYDPRSGVVFDEIDDAINAALGGTTGGGGAPPPKPPAQEQPPPPAGFVNVPGTNRIVNTVGTISQSWNPNTGQWDRSPYPPSADDKRAAGAGYTYTSTGGSSTNYAAQNAANKAQTQAAQGGTKDLPPGYIQIADTRAVSRNGLTVATRDPTTGMWINAGFPPNQADKVAVARMVLAERQAGGGTTTTTTGTAQPSVTDILLGREQRSSVSPGVPGAAGLPGTVQPNQAPALPTLAGPAVVPGLGVPSEGRRLMSTGPELNTLVSGRNERPYAYPTGLRPEGGGNINNYMMTAHSTAPAYAQFPTTTFSVPDTYQRGASGFTLPDNGGAFQAFSIPVAVTNPTTTSPGGAAMLTLQGPQNVTIGNTGFVMSPFAANSIGAAYNRDLSNDAATRAVETAMLLDAQAKYGPAGAMALLREADPGIYTGQPGLYGNFQLPGGGARTEGGYIFGGSGGDYSVADRGYEAGGRMMMRGPRMPGPLGRGIDQVIPEPSMIVGMMTGHPYATMSEKGMEPIRDMGNGMMRISPASRHYADGGTIKWINQYGETTELGPGVSPGSGWSQLNPPTTTETAPAYEPPVQTQTQQTPQLVPIDYGGMNYNTNTGVQNWSSQPPANQPTNNLPNGTNDNLPGPIIPIDNGGISVLTGFDPLNPNILTPYQQALQRETMAQHLRDTVDNPRRAAAGLGRSTGIEVLPGQTPTEPLGAGMFYNMTPQLQQAANDIASRQREIAALDQADPNWSRIVQLGNALDDMDRIRALEVVKAGDLGTASVTPTTATGVSTAGLEEQLKKLEYDAQLIAANHNSFEAAQQLGYDSPRAAAEQAAAVRNQLLHAQAAASTDATYAAQRIANADAQIAELRNRLPAGADQAAYRAELANLMSQQNRSQQRVNLVNEVANLVKRGVPSLSGPLLPVAA